VDLFAPRSKTNWKSWHALWLSAPLLVGILFFGSLALTENDWASVQRTSAGRIGDCERSGRSGYSCNYLFSVGSDEYRGKDQSDSYLLYGQTVDIYYSSENPAISALEDFSKKSQRDRNIVYMLIVAIAIFPARILYAKRRS
jgi:hypothetical protein